MKKKTKLVVSTLFLAAFLVGPIAASASPWPGCAGNKPCYEGSV